MADEGRVITTKLPAELITNLDRIADRADRSKSWIVRRAIRDWIAEEDRRYELTLDASESVDEGRTNGQGRC